MVPALGERLLVLVFAAIGQPRAGEARTIRCLLHRRLGGVADGEESSR
jgi:hypothetical protein